MTSWGKWPWKPWVLSTHLPPRQELTQMGQQKKQQKMVEVERRRIHQEVCGYRASVNKLQCWSLRLLVAAQTLNQEEGLSNNTVFLTDCRSILQSLLSPGGEQISATSDKSCFCSTAQHFESSRPEWRFSSMKYNRDTPFWSGTLDLWPSNGSFLTVVLEAMRQKSGCQKWE